MMKYLIILEQTETGYSAYSSRSSRLCTTGSTSQETTHNMQDAIEFHLEGLKLEGFPIPIPCSQSAYVEVAT